MKVEKKITFVVAGIEFDNLKVAQFFHRYVTAVQARVGKLFHAGDVLNEMRTFTNADAADLDDQDVVAYVMALQMPKPARKKKKNIMNHETHEDALLFSPGFKNMDPAPGEQEEAIDAFDTTFAKVSTPVDVTTEAPSEYW